MPTINQRWVHGLHFNNLRGDLFGGLTAAVVALPLALAFGVSSGLGPIAGLYGAIATGFFAALGGGTPSQVTGPTGPMTVVITGVAATIMAEYGPEGVYMVFAVVVLGGLLQIAMGLLRLGQYITLMPYTVISGFMSGIGLIIIAIQLGPLLGHEAPGKVVDSLQQLPVFLAHPNLWALGLGLLTLAVVFLTPDRIKGIVPPPLLALVLGTIVSLLIPDNAGVLRIDEIPTGLPALHLPHFPLEQWGLIFQYGLVLAVLGAIDSLLTSLVADSLTQTQHDSDRELIGQGVGNCISGLLGGLPGAGATMRTVINVKAGGQTPLSGMIHALVLLLVVLGAGPLTQEIPHAVLAGILIKVGLDIIDWSFLKRAHRISYKATGLMYGVMLMTVFVDLITAVAVGVFVANLLTVKSLTEVQVEGIRDIDQADTASTLNREEAAVFRQIQGQVLLLHLSGPMSFGAAKSLSQRLSIARRYRALILDLTNVPRIGVTASLAIENMVREARNNQREVYVVGAQGKVRDRLRRLDIVQYLPPYSFSMTRMEVLECLLHTYGSYPMPLDPTIYETPAAYCNLPEHDREIQALDTPVMPPIRSTEVVIHPEHQPRQR
ncbi:MAG: SulP family inorganic anion transporter [Prochlorothrix sp.]